ncbi:MAG: hypothetical protein Q7U76_11070 [Nitrospirota bacterium]|nr:hypothetical protein [Nitrospirota bacterium]
MNILCAWCEEEGKQALIGVTESDPSTMATHGICRQHEVALLTQIATLARKMKRKDRAPVLYGGARGGGAVPTAVHSRKLNLPER